MKKVLNFAVNTRNGKKLFLTICAVVTASMVIGLILSIPAFWMKNAYDGTWMDLVAPYFFYPFLAYAALMLFFFMPYLWHVGTSETYTGDARGLMKGMAIFCSMVPGAFFYSFIVDALFIPYGPHNLIGMLICGACYTWIVSTLLKKQFRVAQTFIPLA